MKNTIKPSKKYLNELIAFRERVRVELLGQTDAEYRKLVQKLLDATDKKIDEVHDYLLAEMESKTLLGV